MADMDSITRDALKRAQQMNGYSKRNNNSAKQTPPPQVPQEKSAEILQELQPEKAEVIQQDKSPNFLDTLLGNKEQSLILLLLVLLMNEDCDPSLLLALLYLLL